MYNHATKPAPERSGLSTPSILIRRWRVFRPDGAKWRPGHYLKLVYGICGLAFLVFTSLTGTVGESETIKANTPPSAWYWRWLAPAPVDNGKIFNPDAGDPYRDADAAANGANTGQQKTTASWGTDLKRHNVRSWMGNGAVFYLRYGLLSGLLGLLGGICWAALIEWPTRPGIPLPHRPTRGRRWFRSFGRSALTMIDTVPKFLLLIAICALGGELTPIKFSLALAVFLMFGTATLFRDRIEAFLAGEQYLYALEIGLSRARIFFVHLLRRQLVPLFLVQLPFMVSAFLLWEATLSYFDWGPSTATWGALLRDNFQREQCYWALWIPLLSLLLVISSLYVLGDALRERVEADHR